MPRRSLVKSAAAWPEIFPRLALDDFRADRYEENTLESQEGETRNLTPPRPLAERGERSIWN